MTATAYISHSLYILAADKLSHASYTEQPQSGACVMLCWRSGSVNGQCLDNLLRQKVPFVS